MFDSTFRARTAARTASTLHTALDDWRASDGGWFDNSIGSVDARIAKVDVLIHRFRSAGITPFNDGVVAQLRSERDDLTDFRESMLNAHQDRVPDTLPRVAAHEYLHAFNMVAVRAFVRENIEAAHVPEELAERARRHVALHEPTASAEGFAATCLLVASQIPQTRTAAVLPTHFPDFPDHLLFS